MMLDKPFFRHILKLAVPAISRRWLGGKPCANGGRAWGGAPGRDFGVLRGG